MDFYTATVYGLVQGLCEFLPVSSSGHLALLPFVMSTPDPGPVFDLVMHLGTMLAVILYFRKKIGNLLQFRKENRAFITHFIITTGVTGVLALIFEKYSKLYARDLLFIGINSIIFGILLQVSHYQKNRHYQLFSQPKQYLKAIILGLAQAFAVFPGVSRSGITLTTSRFLGMDAVSACEYSFLLSLPPVCIGALVKLIQTNGAHIASLPMLWGLFLSFLLGLSTIHFFLSLIAKSGPWFFCLYRVILGLICIGVYATR